MIRLALARVGQVEKSGRVHKSGSGKTIPRIVFFSPRSESILVHEKIERITNVIRSILVDEDGFGPSKLTQQIYSLPPLATRELVHMKLKGKVELVDGLEPPAC